MENYQFQNHKPNNDMIKAANVLNKIYSGMTLEQRQHIATYNHIARQRQGNLPELTKEEMAIIKALKILKGTRAIRRGGGLESLEDKVQELCQAYVDQTNSLLKILKDKGYVPKQTPYFDIPNMTSEGLDDALEKLLKDIETNPLSADLETLPSVKEIMEELDGVYVDPADVGQVKGRRVNGSDDVRLNGDNKIHDLPKILRSLKDDNHKLIRLHMDIKDAVRSLKADRPIKKYGSVLDALLAEF